MGVNSFLLSQRKNWSIPRDSTNWIHDKGHTSLFSKGRGAFELCLDLIPFRWYVGSLTTRYALHSSWQGS